MGVALGILFLGVFRVLPLALQSVKIFGVKGESSFGRGNHRSLTALLFVQRGGRFPPPPLNFIRRLMEMINDKYALDFGNRVRHERMLI